MGYPTGPFFINPPTYGSYLWASSEGSGTYARYLGTLNGLVSFNTKDNNSTARRVRGLSFLSVLWPWIENLVTFELFKQHICLSFSVQFIPDFEFLFLIIVFYPLEPLFVY